MKKYGFIVFSLPLLLSIQSIHRSTSHSVTKIQTEAVIIELGMADDQVSKRWRNALESRMSKERLDSVSALRRPMSNEEKAWIRLINSKTSKWNLFRDSLEIPFPGCRVTDTIYVLLGLFGTDDGFTYQHNTVCFDLTALQVNYGNADLPENEERIDRLFAHEFTHLIHKEWAVKNRLILRTFKDSILWECLYEGIGMYRSLSNKWRPQRGVLPEISKQTLEKLQPIFVDNLIKVVSSQTLSQAERKSIAANLSRGPVEKKWGAFTVAIWLSLEADGNQKNLVNWMNRGLEAVSLLAQKHLSGINKTRFENDFLKKP